MSQLRCQARRVATSVIISHSNVLHGNVQSYVRPDEYIITYRRVEPRYTLCHAVLPTKYTCERKPLILKMISIFESARDQPLASPYCWSWGRILATRSVNVDQNARVALRIGTRKCYKRTRCATSPVADTDLAARNVYLSATRCASLVKGDLLSAQNIVTAWGGLGNREAVRRVVQIT